MKNIRTRLLGISMATCLCLGLVACGKSSAPTTTFEPLPEEDTTTYRVGVIASGDNTYYSTMQQGFVDALNDTIGEDHLKLVTETIDEEHDGESICRDFLSKNVDLIYADGKSALVSSSIATMETPIVATGIYDFQTTLHIISSGSWDRLTGRNVTGITAFPAIAEQLSLLIEATPTLDAVGLLYVAGDTDAIYQNELLERYLNQAGIPWKEYELVLSSDLAAKEAAAEEDVEESEEESEEATESEEEEAPRRKDSIITPMDVVKASGKEGANTNITSIGQTSIISGLLSHDSVRTAKTSEEWGRYKEASYRQVATEVLKVLEDEECDADTLKEAFPDFTEEQIDFLLENREDLTEDSLTAQLVSDNSNRIISYDNGNTTEEIIEQAASECSAFYFSAGSSLLEDVEEITDIANEHGVSTVSGDAEIGQYTLVNFYSDPYDMGYRAGKQAYRILVGGEDPAEIKVGLPDGADYVKLYNADIAELFERTFPKSFQEFHEYLESYVPGTNTKRVTASAEE
ncbi:MAG: hypothetical protein IIZ31_06390 [Lachnospiraceae bacterium]|nr:hypothetical protein [Lachnospiraceae bacterium]